MIILGLILGAFFPRLLFFILWISTTLVDRAFTGFLLPLLGIIFLPFTSLFYVLAYNPIAGGLTGGSWIWVLLGFLIDLSSYSYSGYKGSHHQTPHAVI
jgi:hypothetical protein